MYGWGLGFLLGISLACSSNEPPKEVIEPKTKHPQGDGLRAVELYLSRLEPYDGLQECVAVITGPAERIFKVEEEEELRGLIDEHLLDGFDAFHRCFYELCLDLIQEMHSRDLTLARKKEVFLESTKRLWLLARALDGRGGGGQQVYEGYLRRVYLKLSFEIFGRRLVPLKG